ncbi:MAG: D-sedoheptulose-7-phosphate isomerase [bacterium]
MKHDWQAEVKARIALLEEAVALDPQVERAAELLKKAVASGHKVMVFGNGGSAADAHHFVAELVGRYKRDRRGVPALALTSDPSIVSAVSNDYGFEQVFARQVAAYGNPGDAAVAMSTSGASINVLSACEEARHRGMTVIALIGVKPSKLQKTADVCIAVPSDDTALIQEIHMAILHTWARLIEEEIS